MAVNLIGIFLLWPPSCTGETIFTGIGYVFCEVIGNFSQRVGGLYTSNTVCLVVCFDHTSIKQEQIRFVFNFFLYGFSWDDPVNEEIPNRF